MERKRKVFSPVLNQSLARTVLGGQISKLTATTAPHTVAPPLIEYVRLGFPSTVSLDKGGAARRVVLAAKTQVSRFRPYS